MRVTTSSISSLPWRRLRKLGPRLVPIKPRVALWECRLTHTPFAPYTTQEPEVDTTLANSDVTTKYLEAAKIANLALKEVAALCVADAKLVDICRAGDDFINAQTALIYRGKGKDGKPIERGVAFPVCVSVNEVVCHCSPLESDDKVSTYTQNRARKGYEHTMSVIVDRSLFWDRWFMLNLAPALWRVHDPHINLGTLGLPCGSAQTLYSYGQ